MSQLPLPLNPLRQRWFVSLGLALSTGLLMSLLIRASPPSRIATNPWFNLKLQLTTPEANLTLQTDPEIKIIFRQPVLNLRTVTDLFGLARSKGRATVDTDRLVVGKPDDVTVRLRFEGEQLVSVDLPRSMKSCATSGQLFESLRELGQSRCDFEQHATYSISSKNGGPTVTAQTAQQLPISSILIEFIADNRLVSRMHGQWSVHHSGAETETIVSLGRFRLFAKNREIILYW